MTPLPMSPAALLRAAALLILVPLAAAADGPPPDSIAQRVKACTACHGEQGRATPDGFYPRIAGKPAEYLYRQLRGFRDGRRHAAAMEPMVDRLTDGYLMEIAGYFAALDLPYPPPSGSGGPPRGEQLVSKGDAARELPACVACHGAAMTGVLPATPGLLGLPRDYLVAQIGAWQSGQRRAVEPDCMATIAKRLTPDDISAVTTWLASQPLPASTHPAAALPGRPPLDCGGR